MKQFAFFFTAIIFLNCGTAVSSEKPLDVVPELDLERYEGLWYEIARLPNRFQKMCEKDVTATYKLQEDGTVVVTNACVRDDGEVEQAEGVARISDPNGPSSKLEVRFAPSFLSFLPFVWGDYWVIDLAPDYSHAVVGNPGRDYLWVLSRTPQLDQTRYDMILQRIEASGYNPDELVLTVQSEGQPDQ